jgi:hypothetical protein
VLEAPALNTCAKAGFKWREITHRTSLTEGPEGGSTPFALKPALHHGGRRKAGEPSGVNQQCVVRISASPGKLLGM